MVVYDKNWKQVSSKKFEYNEKYKISYTAVAGKYAITVFENKECIVFDMTKDGDSKPHLQKTLQSLPL